uniref:Uncharacterized protein n=1 Tax=Kalanchoe fedtschenkoi TaxID=63787 RepID=A0A7N0VH92_KALFE
MGRAPCCDKDSVKRGPWSPEEDAKLKDYIEKHGTGGNWIALPHKIGLQRCGKSCRLRWLNYLRPNIRHGGFSEEEDNIICSLYISIGSRWSIIAAQLPGRTDNDIKNYWNTKLKKKLLGRHKQSSISSRLIPSTHSKDPNDAQEDPQQHALSNSALERLQLHLQLQSLQNPTSCYNNNPTLWPRLHPLQEKMIQQNLLFINQNETLIPSTVVVSSQQQAVGHENVSDYSFYKPQQLDATYTKLMTSSSEAVSDEYFGSISSSTVVPKLDAGAADLNPKTFQDEYESFLSSDKMAELVSQVDEFDYFKEADSSKDQSSSFIWGSSNEFDSKSPTSTSWNTSSRLPCDHQMFQDFTFGL